MYIKIFNEITKEILTTSVGFKIKKIILTGSYAAKLLMKEDYQQKGILDFNYYIYLDGEDIEIYKMNQIIHRTIELALARKELDFTIDIHPFAFYIPNNKANIQLTTRAISTKNMDDFANYCWNGWAMNSYVLYENKELVDPFLCIPKLIKDEKWEVAISQALSSYRNKILNLPLFITDYRYQLYEIIRYCKEIIKDGIQINMKNNDYERGLHFKYLHAGKKGVLQFYKDNKLFLERINIIEEILAYNDQIYNEINGIDEKIDSYLETFFILYKAWIEVLSKVNPKVRLNQMQWF